MSPNKSPAAVVNCEATQNVNNQSKEKERDKFTGPIASSKQ